MTEVAIDTAAATLVQREKEGETVKKRFVIRRHDSFGRFYDFKLPEWANVIVVCARRRGGLEPIRLILPHQLYVKELKRYFDSDPSIRSITVIPAASGDLAIDVLERP